MAKTVLELRPILTFLCDLFAFYNTEIDIKKCQTKNVNTTTRMNCFFYFQIFLDGIFQIIISNLFFYSLGFLVVICYEHLDQKRINSLTYSSWPFCNF